MNPRGNVYALFGLVLILLFCGLSGADENDLTWSTLLGGSSTDYGYGIALDGSGNVYVTGQTSSDDFPVSTGALDEVLDGDSDAFVVKLNPAADTLEYATYLGGGDLEDSEGIVVDDSGKVYIIGVTRSEDFPSTAGAFDTSLAGFQDVFMAKLNETGNALDYATYLGGGFGDFGNDIAVDDSGRAYAVGATWSVDFPFTAGAFDTSHNGGLSDAFVAKLSATGSALGYASFLGGNSEEEGYDIAVDGSGNTYVIGYTNSANFPTTAGAWDTTYNGLYDLFVAKLNATGDTLNYSTFLGGSDDDYGHGMILDNSGCVYLTGETNSGDFPTTAGAFDTSYNANSDAFMVKLCPGEDTLDYSTFLGGNDVDAAWGITLDNARYAYLSGETNSPDFPITPNAFDTTYNEGSDAFVVKLDSTGGILSYATFLGGNDADRGRGIAVDGSGNVHVTGYTVSPDFPTTAGAFDTSLSGGDAFVAKLDVGGDENPQAIDDLRIVLESEPKLNGGDIRLWWSEPYDDVGVTSYVIYRSTVPCSLGDSLFSTSDTFYVDVGAAGNVDTNYFYAVKAVDGSSNKSGQSNRVGEYDYGLEATPGTDYSWIVFSLVDTSLVMASDLKAHIEANSSPSCTCYTISYWEPTSQKLEDFITVPIPSGDFLLQPGNPYQVVVSNDAVWTLTGEVLASNSLSFQLEATAGTDYSWISLSPDLDTLQMASDLKAHIDANSSPPCTCYTISYWELTSQKLEDYITVPIPSGDFPIRSGQAYRVVISTDAVWPAP